MDLEGVAKIFLVAAAGFVAAGSALQALAELKTYEDLYDESSANKVAGSAVRFTFNSAQGIPDVSALFTLYTSAREAIRWAVKARAEEPEKWSRAVEALIRARNWAVVLTGGIIAFAGTTLDLVAYFTSG
jgi:hypothetical protein